MAAGRKKATGRFRAASPDKNRDRTSLRRSASPTRPPTAPTGVKRGNKRKAGSRSSAAEAHKRIKNVHSSTLNYASLPHDIHQIIFDHLPQNDIINVRKAVPELFRRKTAERATWKTVDVDLDSKSMAGFIPRSTDRTHDMQIVQQIIQHTHHLILRVPGYTKPWANTFCIWLFNELRRAQNITTLEFRDSQLNARAWNALRAMFSRDIFGTESIIKDTVIRIVFPSTTFEVFVNKMAAWNRSDRKSRLDIAPKLGTATFVTSRNNPNSRTSKRHITATVQGTPVTLYGTWISDFTDDLRDLSVTDRDLGEARSKGVGSISSYAIDILNRCGRIGSPISVTLRPMTVDRNSWNSMYLKSPSFYGSMYGFEIGPEFVDLPAGTDFGPMLNFVSPDSLRLEGFGMASAFMDFFGHQYAFSGLDFENLKRLELISCTEWSYILATDNGHVDDHRLGLLPNLEEFVFQNLEHGTCILARFLISRFLKSLKTMPRLRKLHFHASRVSFGEDVLKSDECPDGYPPGLWEVLSQYTPNLEDLDIRIDKIPMNLEHKSKAPFDVISECCPNLRPFGFNYDGVHRKVLERPDFDDAYRGLTGPDLLQPSNREHLPPGRWKLASALARLLNLENVTLYMKPVLRRLHSPDVEGVRCPFTRVANDLHESIGRLTQMMHEASDAPMPSRYPLKTITMHTGKICDRNLHLDKTFSYTYDRAVHPTPAPTSPMSYSYDRATDPVPKDIRHTEGLPRPRPNFKKAFVRAKATARDREIIDGMDLPWDSQTWRKGLLPKKSAKLSFVPGVVSGRQF